jgi:hypothetical protein
LLILLKIINYKNYCTIRAIRNLKKRTAVRKLDNMYFFMIDKCFQYIPKRNAIKKYDCK